MALPALKNAIEELAILPPSFDLIKAMALVDDVRAFERSVDQLETDTAIWRAKIIQGAAGLRAGFAEREKTMPIEAFREQVRPWIARAMENADTGIESHIVSIERDPQVKQNLVRLGAISPDLARRMRRLFRRADAVRKKQLKAYSDMRDMLLVLDMDYDPDAQPTGEVLTSKEDIEKFFEGLGTE